MKLRNTKKYILTVPGLAVLFWAYPARAVCPLCTIAVGAGVGLSRYLGIEDNITGTWIGGLIISLSFWTNNWLMGKNIKIRHQKILLVLAYYIIIIGSLYWKNVIGHALNKLCGIDKLLLGVIAGSFGFWAGSALHLHFKKKNGNKVSFPFQKVAFGVTPLVILSVFFYILSRC